ncbi:short-chain collagen C4-like isoform X2 [Branchiostoma lanceolatum]|uniref:short-chain collagen C4-like isoform X2 n=1 Tax=Branchiostoma lanceolatum TaxID=7740 RepID=UPI003453040E
MSSGKLPYGPLTPERSPRRERTGGPPGSLVGLLLGASAMFASVVVLLVIVQNIGHEMGDLRARVERDREDIAKLQARAEKDLKEIFALRERIVVLETQTRDGSFLTNHAEQQTPDPSGPVPNPEGDSGDVSVIDTGVQSSNATPGGHLYRHKREVPNANWVRLPAGSCQAGRDGRDGIPGASGLQGPPGQKGDLGQPGSKGDRGTGAKGEKGNVGLQGTKGQKGAIGQPGSPDTGAKGAKGNTGLQGAKGQKGAQGMTGNNGAGGAVYVRWGRKTCPSGRTTVYSGVAGGTASGDTGGGANYQCLPTNPQWGRYQNGVHRYSAYMFGAEYRLGTNVPFGSTSLDAHDVPCAVCYVPTRGSKLMIPARKTCPTGWTEEYDGYLMAGSYTHASVKEYVCVDYSPETVQGGQANQASARFYPVEARCGSLPCPSYVEGRELTCVVCTK